MPQVAASWGAIAIGSTVVVVVVHVNGVLAQVFLGHWLLALGKRTQLVFEQSSNLCCSTSLQLASEHAQYASFDS